MNIACVWLINKKCLFAVALPTNTHTHTHFEFIALIYKTLCCNIFTISTASMEHKQTQCVKCKEGAATMTMVLVRLKNCNTPSDYLLLSKEMKWNEMMMMVANERKYPWRVRDKQWHKLIGKTAPYFIYSQVTWWFLLSPSSFDREEKNQMSTKITLPSDFFSFAELLSHYPHLLCKRIEKRKRCYFVTIFFSHWVFTCVSIIIHEKYDDLAFWVWQIATASVHIFTGVEWQ